jgi:hypothetical protein
MGFLVALRQAIGTTEIAHIRDGQAQIREAPPEAVFDGRVVVQSLSFPNGRPQRFPCDPGDQTIFPYRNLGHGCSECFAFS